jgi:hypothetical protein
MSDGLSKRIEKFLPSNIEWPRRLNYATGWLRANNGGVEAIRGWGQCVTTPRLVEVDFLAAFRSERRNA